MAAKRTKDIEAWSVFLWTHSVLLKKLEGEMKDELGIPLTWFDVLAQLETAPDGRLRMSQLADSLVLSASGLTRRLDQMEKAALIRRDLCADDRRGFYAILTKIGRDLVARAWTVHIKGIKKHFNRHLTKNEIAVLEKAFARVIDAELRSTD
jgi:DNA-binding MarR family transcriptional regulator